MNYHYFGCYTEVTNSRSLASATLIDYTAMSVEECATFLPANVYSFWLEYAENVILEMCCKQVVWLLLPLTAILHATELLQSCVEREILSVYEVNS